MLARDREEDPEDGAEGSGEGTEVEGGKMSLDPPAKPITLPGLPRMSRARLWLLSGTICSLHSLVGYDRCLPPACSGGGVEASPSFLGSHGSDHYGGPSLCQVPR